MLSPYAEKEMSLRKRNAVINLTILFNKDNKGCVHLELIIETG